jgi:hypothetical protein
LIFRLDALHANLIQLKTEVYYQPQEGKAPYSIGKELSAWLEKLFEVHISPRTIESRANRQKNTSNEVKKSNNAIKAIT